MAAPMFNEEQWEHYAPHTLFDDLSVGGNSIPLTGFSTEALAYMWNTYGSRLMPVNYQPQWFTCREGRKYSWTIIHFFLLFVYIHMYPSQGQMHLGLSILHPPWGSI